MPDGDCCEEDLRTPVSVPSLFTKIAEEVREEASKRIGCQEDTREGGEDMPMWMGQLDLKLSCCFFVTLGGGSCCPGREARGCLAQVDLCQIPRGDSHSCKSELHFLPSKL
jgi:hypothetical protein